MSEMTIPVQAEGLSCNKEAFTQAMAAAVTAVTIVTTDGLAGRCGITVSAVASVSAEPPMLLVCINRKSPASAAIRTNKGFCVNVLAACQHDLADVFAGRPAKGPAFSFKRGAWYQTEVGALRLHGATAAFDCMLDQFIDAGTHVICIGRVKGIYQGEDPALLYSCRSYGIAAPMPALL